MESGLLHYQFIPSDISGVITEAVDSVRLLAESKKIRIAFTSDAGLPRAMIDRAKMAQGLINLLGNAIKFTPGGGSVRVSARTVDSEQHKPCYKRLCTDDA